MRHRIWVGGPVPPGAAAITLGPVIIVRRSARAAPGWPRLYRHELVHVRQWSELGLFRFLWRYGTSYVGLRLRGWPHWAAYRRIPIEVEAEWEARLALPTVTPDR